MSKRKKRARRHDPRSMTKEQFVAMRVEQVLRVRRECERKWARAPWARLPGLP